jgi:hypothetical protein
MRRNKSILVLTAAALVLSFAGAGFAATKLKTIGRYTFVRVRGNVPTPDVMKTLFDRYAGDIKYGFDLAGSGDLALPFLDQLKNAQFESKQLAVGDRVVWMLFRSQDKVKVARDVEWAGTKPLDVYSIKIIKDFKSYEFLMPRPCGNIALYKTSDLNPVPICNISVNPGKCNVNDPITVDVGATQYAKSMDVDVFDATGAKVAAKTLTPDSPKWQTSLAKPGDYTFKVRTYDFKGELAGSGCSAKAYVNYPPVCKLWTSCLPCEDYVGRPVVFDANGSTDPDGEIAKATFEITDASGRVIDTFVDTEKPFTFEKVFNKAGKYAVSLVVADEMGAVSAEPCRLEFEITQRRLFLLFEAGPLLAKGTYTMFLFARGGILYKLVPDTLDFILAVGVAPKLKGDPWRTFFLANAVLNLHAGPAFIGGGFGYSSQEQVGRKSGVDAVGQVGVDLFKGYRSAGSLFLEFRSPLGGDRSFDLHHKFALGFRYIF